MLSKNRIYLICLLWLTLVGAHAQTRISLLPSIGMGITQQSTPQIAADAQSGRRYTQAILGLMLELRHQQWGITLGTRFMSDMWSVALDAPANFTIKGGSALKYPFTGNVARQQWVLMLDREVLDIPLYRRGDAQMSYTLGVRVRPYLGLTHNTTTRHANPRGAWDTVYRVDYDAPNYLVFEYNKRDFTYWGYTLGVGLQTYWRRSNLLRLDIGYQSGFSQANNINVVYAFNNVGARNVQIGLKGAGWWAQAQWCITLWRSDR